MIRVDELSVSFRRTAPDGVVFELSPPGELLASAAPALPLFEGWLEDGTLEVRAAGVAEGPFSAALRLDGVARGAAAEPTFGEREGPVFPFRVALSLPLRELAAHAGERVALDLSLPGRALRLLRLRPVSLRGPGPSFSSLDLADATDAALFDAPPRRLFDLQNPEEGLWAGTGKWRLLLTAEWALGTGDPWALDTRPSLVSSPWQAEAGLAAVLTEEPTRRAGGRVTEAELVLDTSHPALAPVPPEGKDVPLDVSASHAVTFGEHAARLRWTARLPVRLRDPSQSLRSFRRLSAVGVDFGTTSSVAALVQRGYRVLLRLGSGERAASAENPTVLLVEDHERLWAEMARVAAGERFPYLVRVVRGSHAAREAETQTPSAVVGELKSLPERVISLDQSPQLRDRERGRDFLLDEGRVRVLIRVYGYLLGRAINRPGQDVFLRYRLTHPAKFDDRARALVEEELKAGLTLSVPEGIDAQEISVEMAGSEPEAFAAEVCPELAAHPEVEPLVGAAGELRFAVFDFGGGTLDVACGRYRPATEAEQRELGGSTVIETLQTSGDHHLGGDYLTHELAWLSHQHPDVLPEMEDREVPMMRPQAAPPDELAAKPQLYKRSLAARQNRVRFTRELGLERVKHDRGTRPLAPESLVAARLDGAEVPLASPGRATEALHAALSQHLAARVRDGVRILKTMLASTPWGGAGDWREQGVIILLAGNSSRSEYVEAALREELGVPELRVWSPGCGAPFFPVVRWETPPRVERGVTVVGVSPKTAVSLGALKIANREMHLVRHAQGFGYFLGDLRGFPPKFVALVPMGEPPVDPSSPEGRWTDFGPWDTAAPLRVAREYEPGKMTSSDPRVSFVPTGLAPGEKGRLFVQVTAPEEIALRLDRPGDEPRTARLNLAQYLR
ncbi:MAG: hypothetical protein IT374_15275 [Polyangiaceae bacterium]|nr:hypothetical protein [Polyangiaceae bacterium]